MSFEFQNKSTGYISKIVSRLHYNSSFEHVIQGRLKISCVFLWLAANSTCLSFQWIDENLKQCVSAIITHFNCDIYAAADISSMPSGF